MTPARGPLVNALTVDVEDYFQVSGFERTVERADWSRYESRVARNTDRVLALLADANVHATFFVLGWVAERVPALVRRIAAGGHEVASHGHEHRLVYRQDPKAFGADLGRARAAIEEACGVRVQGFRAPSFSITAASMWALDVLIEHGYTYDSSVYPIRRDRYGIPGAPRHPHVIGRPQGRIWELPPATMRVAGATLPAAGGGYLRLAPYCWTSAALRRTNERDGQPAVVYVHPWELDPGQPRLPATVVSRFRHYVNLRRTEPRLVRLLGEFAFGSIEEVLAARLEAAGVPARPRGARLVPDAREATAGASAC